MLPDFPELKLELKKVLFLRIRRVSVQKEPVLAGIRHYIQHEGSRQRYEQLSGKSVEQEFKTIGVEFTIPAKDVPTLVGRKWDVKVDEIAEKYAGEMARGLFKKVEEVCDETGNAVSGGGRPLSADLFLEMMSRMETDFDSDGRPTATFVTHPDLMPSFKKIADEIENDPELKRRLEDITRRQREAWTAREDNRKLVE